MNDDELNNFAQRRLRDRKLTASAPQEGVWYYVWLKPHWRIMAFPSPLGRSYGHVEVWGVCVDAMKEHYGLSEDQASRLEHEASYGMPRGRVSFRGKERATTEDGQFVFQWGNDLPTGLNLEAEKKKLIGHFHLTSLFLENPNVLSFQFDGHEVMGAEDKDTVQAVLGKVPY